MQEQEILYPGDCIDVMSRLPIGVADAIVCDPPYGLEFMGKDFDSLTLKWKEFSELPKRVEYWTLFVVQGLRG
jgi:tRNA G10  N-methylase Trm11